MTHKTLNKIMMLRFLEKTFIQFSKYTTQVNTHFRFRNVHSLDPLENVYCI